MSPTFGVVLGLGHGHSFRSRVVRRGAGRRGQRAGGAEAPVDDLGLVDHEAVVVGGGQARHLADRAVDVGDGAAGAADEVVVVVADAGLVARHRARRAGSGGRARRRSGRAASRRPPGGRPREVAADGADDRVGVGVRPGSTEASGPPSAAGSPAARHRAGAAVRRGSARCRSWPVFLNESRILVGDRDLREPSADHVGDRPQPGPGDVADARRSRPGRRWSPGRTGSAALTERQVRRPPSAAFCSATAWPVVPLPAKGSSTRASSGIVSRIRRSSPVGLGDSKRWPTSALSSATAVSVEPISEASQIVRSFLRRPSCSQSFWKTSARRPTRPCRPSGRPGRRAARRSWPPTSARPRARRRRRPA